MQTVPAMKPKRTAAAKVPKVSNVAEFGSHEYLDSRAPTKPEPGVIATRPAIAPEQKPTADHFLSIR